MGTNEKWGFWESWAATGCAGANESSLLLCRAGGQADAGAPAAYKNPGLQRQRSVSHGGGFGHPGGGSTRGGLLHRYTSTTSAAPPPPPSTSTSTTIAPITEAVWIVTHGVGHPSTECTWHVHKRTVGGSPNYSSHPHRGAVGLVMERGLLPEWGKVQWTLVMASPTIYLFVEIIHWRLQRFQQRRGDRL